MASSINASTSGAGGVITSADNSGILNIQTAGTTAVTVDASQNVGIGTTSQTTRLQVTNASASGTGIVNTLRLQHLGTSADDGAKILFTAGTSTDGAGIGSGGKALNSANLLFYTGGSNERMRIDQDGKFYLATTTSNYNSFANINFNGFGNGIDTKWAGTGSIYHLLCTNGNGLVGGVQTSGSSTAFLTSSDYRLKEDVKPMVNALDKVAQIKPVTYKWKVDGSDGQGFIAHELQAVVPDCVIGEKDAVNEDGTIKPQSIDTSFLVATLTAAIQEQQAIITQLQADVAALKGTK